MKKVLYINLSKQKYEIKAVTGLRDYIGGLGLGLKLLQENYDDDPIIFSIGPLNGFFPFASKTSIIFRNEDVVEDLYIGGTLSNRIKFAGLDSIVIGGKSTEPITIDINNETVAFRPIEDDPDNLGLPGKKSVIRPVMDKFLLDKYFATPEKLFEEKMAQLNLRGIVVTGTKTIDIKDVERYQDLYYKILDRTNEITVEKGNNPSCSGCPVGCEKSKFGEIGGNVLVHSLVACDYAGPIYANIGVVFSCLNILGYDYTHEDIEALPAKINKLLKELS